MKPNRQNMSYQEVATTLQSVRSCNLCTSLPLGPKPIFQLHPDAKVLIAGQAPGRKTHEKGIPFDDPSGDRLRDWLNVDRDTFYDAKRFAILPMGFCYPGTGKSGDLPPRPECAEQWRTQLVALLPNVELTLVIGQYAMEWHLPGRKSKTLTATVEDWKTFWPEILPLPHPSPRNNRWLKNNEWFEKDILPVLRKRIERVAV